MMIPSRQNELNLNFCNICEEEFLVMKNFLEPAFQLGKKMKMKENYLQGRKHFSKKERN